MRPSHPIVTLGLPAGDLGPSGYPDSDSVITFDASTVGGTPCKGRKLALTSVSLFGGSVTASSVEATHGKGTVDGLEIDGVAVTATAGDTVPVDDWGEVTLGKTFGRLTAPLVLRLLQDHGSLPAGTRIAVDFAAAPRPAAVGKGKPVSSARPGPKAAGKAKQHAKKHRNRRPPDYPASFFPFLLGGGLAPGARHNRVVATTMKYLGIPYLWGGASPRTGFDCSGLVMYVFAQLGVPLPHYAASQWDSPYAVPVAPKHLAPGDLVFFVGSDGTRKAPGHVGIYVGDGYFIDAPHTGAFVRIDSLSDPRYANQYIGARKIVSQLYTGRRLLAVKTTAPVNRLFVPQITLSPLEEVSAVASVSAPQARNVSRAGAAWVGASLGAVLLLFSAGVFVVRRRRAPDSVPSADPTG